MIRADPQGRRIRKCCVVGQHRSIDVAVRREDRQLRHLSVESPSDLTLGRICRKESVRVLSDISGNRHILARSPYAGNRLPDVAALTTPASHLRLSAPQ